MGSNLFVSLHPQCRYLSIQSTKYFLLCQQSIVKLHIWAANERFGLEALRYFMLVTIFLERSPSIFHLILQIFPHIGRVKCVCYCLGSLNACFYRLMVKLFHIFPCIGNFMLGFKILGCFYITSFLFCNLVLSPFYKISQG